MLPFIVIEPFQVGPVSIQPFGLLVALAILVGVGLATQRAKYVGLNVDDLRTFITWVLVGGFIGAHVLDSLFYHPHEVLAHPWSLIELWAGLSSFGSFVGASLGALGWKHFAIREGVSLGPLLALRIPTRRAIPMRMLPYADVLMAVFPVAWIFGRAGCAVVHDHPGMRAARGAWLSVAHGPGPSTDFYFLHFRHGAEPRYDLGLLEMLFAVVLAAGFALTWRRGSVKGWYIATAASIYAPVRFLLDFLRVGDPEGGDLRYAFLTPAQWACVALLVFGVWLSVRLARAPSQDAPRAPATGTERVNLEPS
jgi:phosphatidylglycerol:prolipoprotein diacylglycerol transferase